MNKPSSITDNDWKLLKVKYKNLKRPLKKLSNNYPVQYLIGNVNFYGYQINVNKNVLIPRFETETLVEKTIKYIKKYKLDKSSVIELGTGSGCISIALKKELEDLNITALDKSITALRVAKLNAKKNKANISFIRNDIFKFNPINKYNILISNPPYLTYTDKVDIKTKYEPQTALYAKNNGLIFYEYIIKTCKKYLNEKNIIAFEIGETQGKYLSEYSKQYFPKSIIKIEKDLSNKDRYLFIINE